MSIEEILEEEPLDDEYCLEPSDEAHDDRVAQALRIPYMREYGSRDTLRWR